jgi:Cu+-exporting ATPase
MVEAAQGSKLPIQAMVDKVTAVFVPIVMGIAALTFCVWLYFGPEPALTFALVNAVSVLMIACPCAMGLATPTSIMVGIGRAAEMGVLFRSGEALQTLRGARVIAFDKTGTLTSGRPELTDFVVLPGFADDEVLRLVASVEAHSEHPIGAAIVAGAAARGLKAGAVAAFEAVPGSGVAATVEGHAVKVGASHYLQRLGFDVTDLRPVAGRLAAEGKSPLYAVIDGRPAAVIAVADPIKPATSEAIRALRALGVRVAMVTGDNAVTAGAVAEALGIEEVAAEVLPGSKVDAVRSLRRRFGAVAFVGDGINDAPALAEADVGLAMGTGTDIAIEAADVVLMSGDLRGVVNGIAISQATIRNIRQNLFWAFVYNASLIPVAAGALYAVNGIVLSPAFAAGSMALSSLFVVSNALRLKRFHPPMSAASAAAPPGNATDVAARVAPE